jgi:hypothetical protein
MGQQLWSERVARPFGEFFDVQDKIVCRVVKLPLATFPMWRANVSPGAMRRARGSWSDCARRVGLRPPELAQRAGPVDLQALYPVSRFSRSGGTHARD